MATSRSPNTETFIEAMSQECIANVLKYPNSYVRLTSKAVDEEISKEILARVELALQLLGIEYFVVSNNVCAVIEE